MNCFARFDALDRSQLASLVDSVVLMAACDDNFAGEHGFVELLRRVHQFERVLPSLQRCPSDGSLNVGVVRVLVSDPWSPVWYIDLFEEIA